MSFNLPNPSLLGILLIISTHTGPQLVYKYPGDLSSDAVERPSFMKSNDFGADDVADYDQDSDNDVASDEYSNSYETKHNHSMYGTELYKQWDAHHLNYYMGTKKDLISFLDEQDFKRKLGNTGTSTKNSIGKALSKRKSQLSKTASNPNSISASGLNTNDTIFGIEPGYICEMLAPPKKMCNSRFEIMVDDKIFLGLPIHRYDNGTWRLRGSKKKERTKNPDNVDGNNNDTGNTSSNPDTKNDNKIKLNLSMFHLVFIMNPPVIECNYRIDEMFHYVISRLSLVLRYEQSKNDFISNQVKVIFDVREQYKDKDDLEAELLRKSSLCKMIQECFTSISQSKIANLSINSKLRSFQIPIKTEFHSLPEQSVPYIPGSHLSSTVNLLGHSGLINVGETTRYSQANNPMNSNYLQQVDQDDGTSDAAEDVVYFALLLLDDPEAIIRDIKTESESTLANFIRMINPTESLIKLSMRNNSLDIVQIKSFAFHLIYWRRARVIQPLSTRSAYIVSPMAPITVSLFEDIKDFKKAFPTLPSLSHFLKQLSSQNKKPPQFATIIPSKDHRDIYLEALSWLIRRGYVTQLQTFIWLKISRKIKIRVEEDLENETSSKKRSGSKFIVGGTDNTSKAPAEIIQHISTTDKEDIVEASAKQINDSINDEDREIDNIKERLKSSSLGPFVSLEDDDDTILLDPGRATTLERRWINKIIYDECKLTPELTKMFYKLLKYMDGKSPLELLLLKENIPRNELRKLLVAIEDHIISVRHW
ncbi:nitrogen permease regulator 3 [Scheffersomyces xylosifermentans]|uniref:nitrogen permease regulator 3 n=1 Tax=Scheffersomyces xylosifermentans TaxID=1304137 RepID=UPI00315D0877